LGCRVVQIVRSGGRIWTTLFLCHFPIPADPGGYNGPKIA